MKRSFRPPVAFVFILALALSSCSGLTELVKRPQVNLVAVDILGLTLTTAELAFDFQVRNPNRSALVLDEVRYHLSVDGRPLADEWHGERIEIPGLGRGTVRLPVTVRYADLAHALGKLFEEDNASYDLQADFRFALPVLGGVTVPLRERGKLPNLRPKFLR